MASEHGRQPGHPANRKAKAPGQPAGMSIRRHQGQDPAGPSVEPASSCRPPACPVGRRAGQSATFQRGRPGTTWTTRDRRGAGASTVTAKLKLRRRPPSTAAGRAIARGLTDAASAPPTSTAIGDYRLAQADRPRAAVSGLGSVQHVAASTRFCRPHLHRRFQPPPRGLLLHAYARNTRVRDPRRHRPPRHPEGQGTTRRPNSARR